MDQRREQLERAMTSLSSGDRSALSVVYDMTSAKLFGIIVRIVRNRERAEDLLQDVYVRVWRNASTFDRAKGTPMTWLCTIARNIALNDLRRASRSAEVPGDLIPDIEDEDLQPTDEWLCDQENFLALKHCLDTLQLDHRRSIVMAYFEGYSHSELADETDVPLGTMKSWIRRGLKGLKGCLSD